MSKPLKPEDRKVLEILNRAVLRALDRKRKLGQYAVMWRDGKVVDVPPEDLPGLENAPETGRRG